MKFNELAVSDGSCVVPTVRTTKNAIRNVRNRRIENGDCCAVCARCVRTGTV